MTDLQGRLALVTGASRGLGRLIARTLAEEGMRLVLAARSAEELGTLARELGGGAKAVPADVSKRADLERLVAAAGEVDVLVNNAGIETVCPFDQMDVDDIRRTIDVNLIAAMMLTRLVLPGMLERKRGHIVNVASLAGKSGPPLSESYAATKAGMIGFTQSLRASYDGTGVSASAICPGFVSGEGMFADRQRESGVKPPRLLGATTPERVARAVVAALTDDLPEVLVTPGPARLLAAVTQLFPRLPGWMIRRMHLRDMYRRSARLPPAGS
jgi:short-subunit dehydrogenase